jgi:hypothetical protein
MRAYLTKNSYGLIQLWKHKPKLCHNPFDKAKLVWETSKKGEYGVESNVIFGKFMDDKPIEEIIKLKNE